MATIRDRSDRSWSGSQDFLGNVRIRGTLTADGIPSMDGLSLVINSNAAAGTNEDPGLKLKGGDGGSEIIQTTLEQDSSADTMHLFMGGGAAGATRKSPTVSIGHSAETGAGIDATLKLTGSTDAGVTKAASVVLLGEEQRLTVTSPADLRLSDSTATVQLAAGALTATSLASVNLSPSGAAQLGATNSAGTTTIASGTSVSIAVPDNTANALRVLEGANEYLKVTTSNGTEAVVIGNATTNPSISQLGSGSATLAGRNIGTDGTNLDAVRAAKVFVASSSATFANAKNIGALTSGLLAVTVSAGEATPSSIGTVTASAGAGDAGKVALLNGSGKFDSSVLPSSSSTPATIMYVGSPGRGAVNTNVLRFSTNVAGRTQGSGITYSDSSNNGTSFRVASAGVYHVNVSYTPTGGSAWCCIKAASAVSNSLGASDTDIIGNAYSEAQGHPVTVCGIAYLAANDYIWVSAERDMDLSTYVNSITVSGPYV